MRYRCLPPEDAILKLKRDFEGECDKVLSELNEIYGVSSCGRTEELIWTIKGARNVTDKVIQMLEGAEKDILVMSSSTPFRTFAEKYPSLRKDYMTIIGIFNRKTTDEGVSVRVISSSDDEARKISNMVPLASVKVNSVKDASFDLKSFVVVVDDNEMLVDIMKEDDGEADLTAVWTNGAEFAYTMSHLLNAKWETSEDYDTVK